jgi:2-polyprenyl-3-methyl-5-hydroxy-6-metoxy-1,4-benzoquinol methylase
MNDKRVPHSFDSVYESSHFYYGLDPLEELQEFLPQYSSSDKALALDLGCGEGRDSLFLASNGLSVLSIDISQKGIDKLAKKAAELDLPVETKCLDVCTFDFPPEAFHVIIARTLLDHLETEQIQQVVHGIKRSLPPKGLVFVEVFTVQDP